MATQTAAEPTVSRPEQIDGHHNGGYDADVFVRVFVASVVLLAAARAVSMAGMV